MKKLEETIEILCQLMCQYFQDRDVNAGNHCAFINDLSGFQLKCTVIPD